MSGFPLRPSRAEFGPTRVDTHPVVDPTRFMGAAVFNLEHWQLAGVGLVVPRAICKLLWDGGLGTLTVEWAAEAWDPMGTSAPTVVRNGVGDYTLVYASTYPDMDGISRATGLVAAEATAQELLNINAVAVPDATHYQVDILVFEADSAAAIDASLLVKVW